MTRRASPEAAIQVAVMRHIAQRGRQDVFAFAVPNGGLRSVSEAQRMKAQGTVAGVPDLCIVIRGFAHFLELKAPGGRVSVAQRFVERKLRDAGAETAVAFNLDDAIAVLDGWGVFRGEAA